MISQVMAYLYDKNHISWDNYRKRNVSVVVAVATNVSTLIIK